MSMTPQALVEAVATSLTMPDSRVKNYDRQLMEAGLRTKKGHGRGSAIMTMRDAAMLVIAIMSADEVNHAAVNAAHLSDFPHRELEGTNNLAPLIKITGRKPHDFKKFGSAIEAMMTHFAGTADASLDDEYHITFEATLMAGIPIWATIEIHRGSRRHEIEFLKEIPADFPVGGLQVKRAVAWLALSYIAKRVAGVAA
jgi:hypothetical protein